MKIFQIFWSSAYNVHCTSNGYIIVHSKEQLAPWTFKYPKMPKLPPFPVREISLVQFLKGENSDPTVALIAESHGKTSAQVLIRYAIDRGLIVIPKSVTPERLAANADVFDFQLTNDEVSTLLGLERGFRVVEIEANKNHKYYPWRENYAE